MPSDDALREKRTGLLDMDYTEACSNCGAVVFEWWDGCRDCDDDSDTGTEQTTLGEST